MWEQFKYDIDIQKVNDVELDIGDYKGLDKDEYPSYPGKEHYKLLGYLSQTVSDSVIIEIGTHHGMSALALSKNKTNTIHTFDIIDKVDPKLKEIENIKFHIENVFEEPVMEKWQETILNSSMIFIDIAQHEGIMEYEFYCFLRDKNYQGLLIADDIWHFKGMRDHFWCHIPSYQKCDVTKYGHWSGTGIIKVFGQKIPMH